MSDRLEIAPNDLSAFWMPFTANRQFKQAPRMFVSAKDMHYTTTDGRKVLDGFAGLWCVNAGHAGPRSPKRLVSRPGNWTIRRHSKWGIRSYSNLPIA